MPSQNPGHCLSEQCETSGEEVQHGSAPNRGKDSERDSHHHRKDVSADRELQRVWNFPQNHSSGWDLFLDRNVEIQEDRAG